MMPRQKMIEKLRAKKGASIAIALLYFLICAMVGAVVLAGASANISHVNREKKDERNYLAVMSAAELLKEQMKGCGVSWSSEPTEQDHPASGEERIAFKEQMGEEIADIAWEGGSPKLKRKLLEEIYQVYVNCLQDDGYLRESFDGSEDSSGTLTFQAGEIDGFERGMPAVSAKYTVKPVDVVLNGDYSQLQIRVDVGFSIAGDTPDQYRMNMSLGGLIHYTLDEEVKTELVTDPEKDPVTGENEVTYVNTYIYTSEATFSPDEPVMSSGEVGP